MASDKHNAEIKIHPRQEYCASYLLFYVLSSNTQMLSEAKAATNIREDTQKKTYKRRYPGNATITKHSLSEAPKKDREVRNK